MENFSTGSRTRRILSRRTVLTSLFAGLAALAACGRNRSAPEPEPGGATESPASPSTSNGTAASSSSGPGATAPTAEPAANPRSIGASASDARRVGHPAGNVSAGVVDSAGQGDMLMPTPTPDSTQSSRSGVILPDRLVIPRIDLDIPVVELGWSTNRNNSGAIFSQWDVAAHAAGWHKNSAVPGQDGNIVMSGHNNILGAVFRQLDQLRRDDEISVYTQGRPRRYRVERVLIVPEKNATDEQRVENARWIAPTQHEQLTLVSCWPRNDNTHRIIVVARPMA